VPGRREAPDGAIGVGSAAEVREPQRPIRPDRAGGGRAGAVFRLARGRVCPQVSCGGEGVTMLASLPELLREADFVSLHAPLRNRPQG
jgi:hypothetical protein